MKKHLILLSLTLTALTATASDIIDPQPVRLTNITSYIPAEYSANGKPALTFLADREVSIYNSSMQQAGTITLRQPDNLNKCGYGVEWRNFITSWSSETKNLMADGITLDEADHHIESDAAYRTLNSFSDGNGATIFISDADANVHKCLYWSWDSRVPSIIIPSSWYVFTPKSGTASTGTLHKVTGSGTPSFKILPELHTGMLEQGGENLPPVIAMQSVSYDHGAATATSHLTQTLFNTDADYEYVRPLMEVRKSEESDSYVLPGYEAPEGLVGQIFYSNPVAIGFEILTETGSILQSIRFPDDLHMSSINGTILRIGGNSYLKFTVYDNSYHKNYELLYRVESSSASVKSIGAPIPVTVYPTELTRGQMLNVHTEADSRLSVYDLNGRRVYTAPVPAGTDTEVPTDGFASGMNIVNVTTPRSSTSTKVIVR